MELEWGREGGKKKDREIEVERERSEKGEMDRE